MKKIIFLLSACLAANYIHAQPVRVGPEIGANFTSLRTVYNGYDDNSNQAKAGLKVGGVIDFRLARHISLQPGLFYSMKGAKWTYSSTYNNGGAMLREREEEDLRINYLEIPINFQIRPGFGGFFIGAGPYVAFAVGGKDDYTRTVRLVSGNGGVIDQKSDNTTLKFGNNAATDDFKNTDAGFNVNMGFMTRRGLFLRGNLGVGLSNIIPGGDEDYSARNWGLGLTMGYLFGRF